MMFKTYETELDGISNKLGFSKRSFADWHIQVKKSFDEAGKGIKGFFSAIPTAFSVKNDDKNFKRIESSGEIVTKDNINSYISKLSPESANELAQQIVNIDKTKGSWQKYFKVLEKGNHSDVIDFIKNTDNLSKITGEDLVKANEAARQSALAHNAALQQQTLGARAATAAAGVLKTALSAIAYFAITQGISFIITKIDEVVNRTQKIKEAATEAKAVIKDIKSEFDNLKSSTEDVGKKFAELAQGVENLGKTNQSRGKLSVEDYDEFLDLSNQLSELYPQLTKGFDDNGNAILNLSGNVNTITSALEGLLDIQQKIANEEILKQMPDVWAGYKVELDEYKKTLYDTQNTKYNLLNAVSKLDSGENFSLKVLSNGKTTNELEAAKIINEAVKEIGRSKILNFSQKKSGNIVKSETDTWNFSVLTEEEISVLKNEINTIISEYESSLQLAKSKMESANSQMSSYINTWLYTEGNFSKMDFKKQNIVKDALFNSNWANALPSNIDTGNWDNVSDWLQKKFLYAINEIKSEEIQAELVNAFNNCFTVGELQNLISRLTDEEGFTADNPLIVYLQAKLKDRVVLEDHVKSKLQDEFDDKVGELSLTELQIAAEQIKINEDDLLSWDELKEKIEEAKKASDKTANSFDNLSEKITQITESTSNAISNIKSFNDAIDKINNNESLSYDEVTELLTLDPSIASGFTKTVDGYSIAVDELIAAKDKIKGVSSSNIEQDIADNTQEIADSEARIKKLTEERQKLYAEINANKDNDHYNGNETYERLLDIDEEIETLTNSIKNGQDLLSVLRLTLGEISESTSTIQQTQVSDGFSKTFNWIETAIEKVSKAASRLGNIVSNTFKSWTDRNSALKKQISEVNKEIDLQQKAYEVYTQKAYSVGLSDYWTDKVRNGSIDISVITDDDLADKIDEFKEWYDKAQDCKEAVDELKESLSELYKTSFDNTIAKFGDIISEIDFNKSMLEEKISRSAQSSYVSFDKNQAALRKNIGYYERLIAQEKRNIAQLEKEKAELTAILRIGIQNGTIIEGTEEWAAMRDKINDVTLAVERANTSLLDYGESINEIYEKLFDNISKNFDNKLNEIQHLSSSYDTGISMLEAKGYLGSVNFYTALQDSQRESLGLLKQELASLQKAFAESGAEEYSDEWFEMRAKILDVNKAIREGELSLLEYAKALREIEWEHFDYLQERISDITTEADFLIDLLDGSTLYDDKGNFTDKGLAALGLHAQNYNVYMAQADKYYRELLSIEKELASDPYNTDLVKRKEELLELQQKSILAAETVVFSLII